jgi:hypothetical protein
MTELHPAQPEHGPGYESPSINLRGVVWFVSVLIPFAIFTHVLIWMIYAHYQKNLEQNDSLTALPQQPMPNNAPPLQPSPPHQRVDREDLAEMHAREQAEFGRRGWTNMRIPDAIVEQVSQMSKQPATRPQP